ncbi:MAG TPA: GNAT family protein [Ktedonobacterales bacterium]
MLRGERVLLRPRKRADLPRVWQFTNDPEFKRLIGDWPFEPQSLERLEARYEAGLAGDDRDGPRFAIEADSVYIGHAFLYDIGEATGLCWLSIGIGDPSYQGKGYGREALRLLLDYAFRIRNLRRVCLDVAAFNERAIRAYRALGFAEEGRLRQHIWIGDRYDDLVCMGLLREEWRAQQASATPPA